VIKTDVIIFLWFGQQRKRKMKSKVCFVIDATGSMMKWLQAAKTQTKTIVDSILEETPDVELEIAAVFYRDYGDVEPYVVVPFTSSVPDYLARIAGVMALGGQDLCEDVAGGLSKMLQLDWDGADVRNAFLICDAPPHGKEWHSVLESDRFPDNEFSLTEILGNIETEGIKLAVIRVNASINTMIEKMNDLLPKLMVLDMLGQETLPPPSPAALSEFCYLPPPGGGFGYSLPDATDDPSDTREAVTLSRQVSACVSQTIASSHDPV
jgi:hypothetical protein